MVTYWQTLRRATALLMTVMVLCMSARPALAQITSTPEELVARMAISLAGAVIGGGINKALFSQSSIDYATLIADFKEIVKEALGAQKIAEDQTNINGFLQFLQNEEVKFANGRAASDVLGLDG